MAAGRNTQELFFRRDVTRINLSVGGASFVTGLPARFRVVTRHVGLMIMY